MKGTVLYTVSWPDGLRAKLDAGILPVNSKYESRTVDNPRRFLRMPSKAQQAEPHHTPQPAPEQDPRCRPAGPMLTRDPTIFGIGKLAAPRLITLLSCGKKNGQPARSLQTAAKCGSK